MTRDEPMRGDLRVQRTRNLIVQALIEITIQKGFAAVTVQDIVTRAGINRATFYRHYRDKFDLLDQFAEEVYTLPDHGPGGGRWRAGEDAAFEMTVAGLARLLEHIRGQAKFFRVMLGPNGDPAFAAKIGQYIQKRIRHLLPEGLLSDDKTADLYLSYVSSGAVGALTWWLEHKTPYSPEQMAAILFRFVAADVATLRQAAS